MLRPQHLSFNFTALRNQVVLNMRSAQSAEQGLGEYVEQAHAWISQHTGLCNTQTACTALVYLAQLAKSVSTFGVTSLPTSSSALAHKLVSLILARRH